MGALLQKEYAQPFQIKSWGLSIWDRFICFNCKLPLSPPPPPPELVLIPRDSYSITKIVLMNLRT